MNKRVRYGEIVQVLSSNKSKHEENSVLTSCIIYPQNARILAHVIVYFIDCIFIFYIFKIKWFSTCTDICHSGLLQNYTHFTYIVEKNHSQNTSKCVEGSNHTYRILFFGLFYILKFLYQKRWNISFITTKLNPKA